MSRLAKSFRDLLVYRRAIDVAQQVFELSKTFPTEERYSLTDQIRRSSRSVGAQIAEAWGKRRYERHFINKLTDADSEQLETQHWVQTAATSGYLSRKQEQELNDGLAEVGRMLHAMMEKAPLFAQGSYKSRIPTDH